MALICLAQYCSLLSGWPHWLWRIRCHDDQGQYGSRAKNNEKQLEYQHEGRTWCTLDFHDVQLVALASSCPTKLSCNFLMLSSVCVDVCFWGFWLNSSIDSMKFEMHNKMSMSRTKLGCKWSHTLLLLNPANVQWTSSYYIYLELLTLKMPYPNAVPCFLLDDQTGRAVIFTNIHRAMWFVNMIWRSGFSFSILYYWRSLSFASPVSPLCFLCA